MTGRYIDIDGIRTHYLEAGEGPTVVLLHSGEFGAAAELSWEFTLPALARHFHVLAPDWLGFGRTDKVFDFADPRGRSVRHLSRFVARMLAERGTDEADFVGNSMGASNLLRIAAESSGLLPIRSLVAASGGGFVPLTPERQTLLSYDGTPEAMRAMLGAMFHDPGWAADEDYVARRQQLALLPGAWECAAAPRLKPAMPTGAASAFGRADPTPYEAIAVPALIVAGAEDRLRLPGYAEELGRRIRHSEVHVFERCGHCPNIEQADRFNDLTIGFLRRVHQKEMPWTTNL
ncbi:2-hydroxy-6-oxo-6-(2'-aminophenyl)hexa-2, 4-dienoic acid hydrolase [Pigmentiphaga humi]|uniref:2-hydroxy-6-oxo-6-(2'-aminophenyl)hexa-2, 4-dienoic acid hydrolase n=1 Tax=Pigmentiphaga humi TaxID=2478468 RepID=A0A3P4B0B1_9BURK|nr:alpha/beta hydrolase [Pigmentiphaga humi]VCU69281.1 2-hydroxy-6-oxo-6-(2'-aminophenyl)hexa-2, 4-dienoic acid hydrolase [Pigmentiphaga humi]